MENEILNKILEEINKVNSEVNSLRKEMDDKFVKLETDMDNKFIEMDKRIKNLNDDSIKAILDLQDSIENEIKRTASERRYVKIAVDRLVEIHSREINVAEESEKYETGTNQE